MLPARRWRRVSRLALLLAALAVAGGVPAGRVGYAEVAAATSATAVAPRPSVALGRRRTQNLPRPSARFIARRLLPSAAAPARHRVLAWAPLYLLHRALLV